MLPSGVALKAMVLPSGESATSVNIRAHLASAHLPAGRETDDLRLARGQASPGSGSAGSRSERLRSTRPVR